MAYKLNIGCFNNTVEGWINVDITPHAFIAKYPILRELLFRLKILTPERYREHLERKFNNILRHDVRKGLPFPSHRCIYIYSSHFIEHLFHFEVVNFFEECYRVLSKGGLVRTVVPDFFSYVQIYSAFRRVRIESLEPENYLNDYKLLKELSSFLLPFFGNAYAKDKKELSKCGHKSLWDAITLAYVLKNAGFSNLRMCSFREGTLPDLEMLETRASGSIYVEAEKQK